MAYICTSFGADNLIAQAVLLTQHGHTDTRAHTVTYASDQPTHFLATAGRPAWDD